MRILLITSHFKLKKGPSTWAKGMFEHLSKNNIDVHILVVSEKVDNNDRKFSFGEISKFEKTIFKYPYISLAKRINKLTKKYHYDIIHTNDADLCGFNAARICRKKKIPLIITLHSKYIIDNQRWSKEQVDKLFSKPLPLFVKLGTFILTSITEYSLKRADLVIVPNKFLQQYLEYQNIKSQIIPNGIDIKRFGFKKRNDSDETVLMTISHMNVPQKVEGIKRLIDAVKIIQNEIKTVKLKIIGSGKYLHLLKEYSNNKKVDVDFLGYREDIPNLLSNCDIYIHSSLHDIFPFTILEAMASKKPIVATKVGGVSEIIQNNENGLLCEPIPIEISKKIVILINDDILAKKIGNAGYETVKKKYSWDTIIKEYKLLYENLIREKHS